MPAPSAFRAEVIGSLLRPASLKAARQRAQHDLVLGPGQVDGRLVWGES